MNNFKYGTHPSSSSDVKLCIYAICKNESKFVRRWLENVWNGGHGADYIVVVDTMSSDNTLEQLEITKAELGIPDSQISISCENISPWRFDVARNTSLMHTPPSDKIDACFCMDIDEIVTEDFWTDVRKTVFEHPDFQRILYKYVWRVKDDGTPDVEIISDKIHGVHGWRWQYPVHEELECDNIEDYTGGVYHLDTNKAYVWHFPDNTKSRGSYLPLLEMRCNENPEDYHGRFLLTREYSFYQRDDDCITCGLSIYSRLPWIKLDNIEKASFCVLIGDGFRHKGMLEDAEWMYRKAISFDSTDVKGYIRLAQMLAYSNRANECLDVINQMDDTCIRTIDWRTSGVYLTTWKPKQIIADAYCWQGKIKEALSVIMEAQEEILKNNDVDLAKSENFFDDFNFIMKQFANQ